MANAAAFVDEALWRRDKEFRALPRTAQCTFVQLLSQKDLDCAGVLTLHVELLAKGCDELTPEDIWSDLKALEQARFIHIDTDTDELLIRSYVRRVSVKSPNAMKAALRLAKMVSSPKLRSALAIELRRIERAEAIAVADEISPLDTPSGTHPEPIRTPSGRGNPSGTHPEPPAPAPVPEPVSPLVGGYVGEEPPSKFCNKHPDGTDHNCGPCRARRIARERWDAEHANDRTDALAAFWTEVRAHPDCDDNGLIDQGHGAQRCRAHDWGRLQ